MRSLFGAAQQQGDGLNRLSQTHIVGQQGTGTPHCQSRHPHVALLLITAQVGLDMFGHLDVCLLSLADAAYERGESLVGLHVHAAFGQSL